MKIGASGAVRSLACSLVLAVGAAAQSGEGAKTMFYDPGGDLRVARIGLRYWFENESGTPFTEAQAVGTPGQYTLRIRANASAFISVWDMSRGIELLSRKALDAGRVLERGIDLDVPDVFEFAPDAPDRRLIIVWGRSQTEQAGRPAGADARLRDLTARVGRDGAPQIVREVDERTPGRIGTYVINREGMAVATELRLRAR